MIFRVGIENNNDDRTIAWALDHPGRVGASVALNTFYGDIAEAPLNPPEAIRLSRNPRFPRLTAHFAASPEQFRWLDELQVGGSSGTPRCANSLSPGVFRQFEDQPSSVGPFLRSTPSSSRPCSPPPNEAASCGPSRRPCAWPSGRTTLT